MGYLEASLEANLEELMILIFENRADVSSVIYLKACIIFNYFITEETIFPSPVIS